MYYLLRHTNILWFSINFLKYEMKTGDFFPEPQDPYVSDHLDRKYRLHNYRDDNGKVMSTSH